MNYWLGLVFLFMSCNPMDSKANKASVNSHKSDTILKTNLDDAVLQNIHSEKKLYSYKKARFVLYYYAFSSGKYRSTNYEYMDYQITPLVNTYNVSYKQDFNSEYITQIHFPNSTDSQEYDGENKSTKGITFINHKNYKINDKTYPVYVYKTSNVYDLISEPTYGITKESSGYIFFNPQYGILVTIVDWKRLSILDTIDTLEIPRALIISILEEQSMYNDIIDLYQRTN